MFWLSEESMGVSKTCRSTPRRVNFSGNDIVGPYERGRFLYVYFGYTSLSGQKSSMLYHIFNETNQFITT